MNLIENMFYEQRSLKENKKVKRNLKEANETQFRGYTIKYGNSGRCTVLDKKTGKPIKTDLTDDEAYAFINNINGRDDDDLTEDIVRKVNESKKRNYKYFAVSENSSDKYYTKQAALKDLKNFGEEVRLYTLKDVDNVQDLTSEDLIGVYKDGKLITEDTVKKSNGKWTNRGDTGKEHGTFKTKKQADAQRKAMYANGYKGESLEEEVEENEIDKGKINKYADERIRAYYNHEIDLPELHDELLDVFGSIQDAVKYLADNDKRIRTESVKRKIKESIDPNNAHVKQVSFDVVVPGDSIPQGSDSKFFNALINACEECGYIMASDTYGWTVEDLTDYYNKGMIQDLINWSNGYEDEIYAGNANGVATESLKEGKPGLIGVRKQQLVNNIEELVGEYLNGIYDGYHEEFKNDDELVDWVYDQLFDFKSSGGGFSRYARGICDDLKYLGKDYIVSEIIRIGHDEGIVNEEVESIQESYNEDDTFSPDYDWEMDANRFDDINSPYYNGDLEDSDFDEYEDWGTRSDVYTNPKSPYYVDATAEDTDNGWTDNQIANRLAKQSVTDNPYEVFDTYGHFGENPGEFDEIVTDLETQLQDPKSRMSLINKMIAG